MIAPTEVLLVRTINQPVSQSTKPVTSLAISLKNAMLP
jgi:hypothetical protein